MKSRDQCKDDNEFVEQFIGSNEKLSSGTYILVRPIVLNGKLTGEEKK